MEPSHPEKHLYEATDDDEEIDNHYTEIGGEINLKELQDSKEEASDIDTHDDESKTFNSVNSAFFLSDGDDLITDSEV